MGFKPAPFLMFFFSAFACYCVVVAPPAPVTFLCFHKNLSLNDPKHCETYAEVKKHAYYDEGFKGTRFEFAEMRKDSKCYASCFVSQPSIKMSS